jgi:hypothetical protein
MAKFKLIKKIELDNLGKDWKDCFINFKAPTYNDLKEIIALSKETKEKQSESALRFLNDRFINGKGIAEDGKMIDMVKEDLAELSVDALVDILTRLSGEPTPKV